MRAKFRLVEAKITTALSAHKTLQIGLAVALLGGITIYLYRPILLTSQLSSQIPWSSDALGHAFKVGYLHQKISAGDFYPDLLPDWYMGLQMLRYYPPLPYYILALLTQIIGDTIVAVNWFIALCALLGGIGWLLFRRWIGLLPALFGGILFLFLPDNVRVAFAEGNLPRVLATAILPYAIFLLLCGLERERAWWHLMGLSFTICLIVLSHAMMAAIYAVCMILLSLLLSIEGWTTLSRAAGSLLSITLGLALAGWWLFPSLTGGITEINAAAMTEALAVFPLANYLNPSLRTGNPEAVYIGAALLVMAIAGLFLKAARSPITVGLTLTGLCGVLITTPFLNQIFNALPLHNLLWPLRFLGVASFMLLLALMWLVSSISSRLIWVAAIVMTVIALDGAGSLHLIHLRPPQPDQLAISEVLDRTQGWREATLDQSRWGSAPTYFFSAQGQREQIFGWAYQGARTARTVSAINEALQYGYVPYLIDRLNLLGTDDVVLPQDLPIQGQIAAELAAAGFQSIYSGHIATLYHRDGAPRAFTMDWKILGIGNGAQNLAYLFPQIHLGTSTRVDDYALDELIQFETIVLSGFNWRDRRNAERLVEQAATRGTQVIVDLTGAPEDPIARIPRFLDVWGERLILAPQAIQLKGSGVTYNLRPIGQAGALWFTHTPQGLDARTITYDYLGQQATALGYKDLGAGRAWFLGLNLPYHAMLSRDPAATELLAGLLHAESGRKTKYAEVLLENYSAGQNGYQFTYSLANAQTLLFPVAHHEGLHVSVDGQPVVLCSFENLVAFAAPAGNHAVKILLQPTPVYHFGSAVSAISLLSIVGVTMFRKKPGFVLGVTVRKVITLVAMMGLLMLFPANARAASPVELDGDFNDWSGQAHIDDPQGDAKNGPTDLRALYFATNPDQEMIYLMAERWQGGSKPIAIRVHIDTNNNGIFDETGDRLISVRYQSISNGSNVTVDVYDGSGGFLATIAANADWGEDIEQGGLRVEWGVSFAQLGILPNQTIRMFLETADANDYSDRGPDSGDIQWSPANALGGPLLAVLLLAGTAWLVYSRKRAS